MPLVKSPSVGSCASSASSSSSSSSTSTGSPEGSEDTLPAPETGVESAGTGVLEDEGASPPSATADCCRAPPPEPALAPPAAGREAKFDSTFSIMSSRRSRSMRSVRSSTRVRFPMTLRISSQLFSRRSSTSFSFEGLRRPMPRLISRLTSSLRSSSSMRFCSQSGFSPVSKSSRRRLI